MIEGMKDLENNLVVQANSLIEASYKLKTSQQKFLRIMASMIKKDDEDLKMYEFKISDLLKLFEVKDRSKYVEIPKQTRELMGNVLTFKTDKKIIQVPFLNYCEYEIGVGMLRVQFHPFLKPFYLYLSKENPYTKYELKNILPLKSVYSIRIYELLKQYEKISNRTIDIDELKKLFQIKPTEYTRYNDFKRFVIIQAQKELPLKTDISFDFEEIKTGRKVTSIKFNITSNIARNQIAATSAKIEEDLQELDTIKKVQEIIKNITENEINDKIAKIFYNKAIKHKEHGNNPFELIIEVAKYSKTQNKEKGFVAWFSGTVEHYIRPFKQNRTENNSSDTFNNYEQRTYDYDDLEKKLLGWDNN